ncbi:MAG: Crp/Fnr family transcriptional regulator [Bdellovibrionales bacterium]|jgi:CRP-like cAMP-binding protein|nr:Crp/Fnr family transcriptional regulator [Bdellovibrionales bacterium]
MLLLWNISTILAMPIIIKQAKSSKQLIDILEHRHLSKYGTPGRSVDALDILPTTLNILAYQEGRIVGSARAVHYDKSDFVSEAQYDFSESSQKLRGSIGLIDTVSVSVSKSSLKILFEYLIKMSVFRLSLKGYKYVFFYAPREMIETLLAMQFISLSDLDATGAQVPMLLKVEDFVKSFELRFADKEILRFREVFYFSIFDASEVLVIEGERGNTAYVAERGSVDVVVQNEENLVSISRIPPGVLIGEVAMITNEPRTASLICAEITPCVAFDRGEFFNIMYSEPHRSVEVFKILSRRLSASNRRIAEMKKV